MIRTRLRLYLILFSIVYWMVVAFYFVTIRYSGLGKYAPPNLDFGVTLAYSAIVGFAIGLLFGLFPVNEILRFRKRKSFLTVLVISTGFHVIFFITIIFLTSLYGNSYDFAVNYVFSPSGLTVLFHLSISSLIYHFILQINKKFGPGVLLEYTFGRYFSPKVEERVFMFLDLKSSTHIAEKLEHVSYSRMVQDCYAELTRPLLFYKAQVYQYVGDEVVVSWKMGRFFSGASCYGFFYAFRDSLENRRDYFVRKYGISPVFKAGMHCGKVTVAEVGEIKTEIAYHGDVINTASRIQSLCNSCEKELLVSESFLSLVPNTDMFRVQFVTDVTLKGKESATKIYTITNS